MSLVLHLAIVVCHAMCFIVFDVGLLCLCLCCSLMFAIVAYLRCV